MLLIFLKNNLTGRFELHNMRIMGKPGCGKTSFLYFLIHESGNDNNKILEDYIFFIFHANRIAGMDKGLGSEMEATIERYILEAFKLFYSKCGKSNIFNQINYKKIPTKFKINECIEYYRK